MNYKRQAAMFNPYDFSDVCVNIIGIGNIGSHAAVSLARMGITKFVLWDPDTIEEHNLSSQSYTRDDIGLSKIQSVANQIISINDEASVLQFQQNFSIEDAYEKGMMSDLFVIGVDSLEARREICQQLQTPGQITVIDGRIGGEQLEVYTVPAQEWEATIPDSATPEPCGGEYIAYVSIMTASIINSQVKKVLTKQTYPKSILMNMGTYDIIKNHAW